MNTLVLLPKDFKSKFTSARKDVPDVPSLRQQMPPAEGSSFIVSQTLFVWKSADKTPDDGLDSIRPSAVPQEHPGRFRRVTFGIPTP
jgi:hypothetical protein